MRLILFVLCACVFAISCKDDYDEPCRAPYADSMFVSPTNMSKLIYEGFDTLTYAGVSGDTFRCFTQDYQSHFTAFPIKSNPECPADSARYEDKTIVLADSLNRLSVSLRLSSVDDRFYVESGASIFVAKLSTLLTADVSVADSLSLGGRTFFNVQILTNAAGDSLYMSREKGIIRIRNAHVVYTLMNP